MDLSFMAAQVRHFSSNLPEHGFFLARPNFLLHLSLDFMGVAGQQVQFSTNLNTIHQDVLHNTISALN